MHHEKIFAVDKYVRLEFEDVPIYLYPDMPDWFIPARRSDWVLQSFLKGRSLVETAQADSRAYGCSVGESVLQIESFLSRFSSTASPYPGRGNQHRLERMKECWFHVTNRCNLSCSHCMFSSTPDASVAMREETIVHTIREVQALGCRVFYFTGGEPFVFTGLTALCDEALRNQDAHVVILTNGLTIPDYKNWISLTDRERVHFQISVDGGKHHHDDVRGRGTFERVMKSIECLKTMKCNTTLAMSVNGTNVHDMMDVVDVAAAGDIHNLHYIWHFQKGKGAKQDLVQADAIVDELIHAQKRAAEQGILIDNIEIIKSQVFSLPGTRYDLSNAGWQSIAIGPDGRVYPSPAMVGEPSMVAGHVSEGVETVWRKSPLLEQVRQASLIDDEAYNRNPLKFLVGGGDMDHSFIHAGYLTGHDPYVEIYNRVALWMLAEEGRSCPLPDGLTILSRMGERLYECGDDMDEHAFTHSNCVLSLPGKDGHTLVRNFYSDAAREPKADIFNPVAYNEVDVSHIPHASRIRSYGCGSPVLDADLKDGECLVDLGCGTGVECFIASKKVGEKGSVIGIDMADAMLSIAETSKQKVVQNLGYVNIQFKKAYLEQLPLDDDSVDVVISNCVINLSPDKRKTFIEIARVLKRGGRLIISDIVYDTDIPLRIKYNEKLRGECIGGAFRENELFAMLRDIGLEGAQLVKRFLYREVEGHPFYSVTYSARKPTKVERQLILYRGPFAAIVTDEGKMLRKGVSTDIELSSRFPLDDSVFVVDEKGHVTNLEQTITCDCFVPPDKKKQANIVSHKRPTGCMVCGAELLYKKDSQKQSCYYCGVERPTHAVCTHGHFVCDDCHARDALSIVQNVCLSSSEKDMIGLMKKIRSHVSFPMHGPEHHSLIPAVLLTAYKNTGGHLTDDDLLSGIERGRSVAGGACAFMGVCGAAVGVGIGFSIILQANPLTAKERQAVMTCTSDVMRSVAKHKAPRCCQRDCFTALREAARLSERCIGIKLYADETYACKQHTRNNECIKRACPLWPEE